MRRISAKRRALYERVRDFRDDFRWRVGRCEVCLKKAGPSVLDIHEVVDGSNRSKALDKRYAILACHRRCHEYLETITIPHQLAYLMRARPQDFQPEKYYALIGRNWPDVSHVIWFLERLDGEHGSLGCQEGCRFTS